MQKEFSIPDMSRWVANAKDNDGLPFITTSALIELSDLEAFVATIKAQQADCVRIYFMRFDINDIPTERVVVNGQVAEGCTWINASPTFTQGTIALVPAKNFAHDEQFIFTADDIRINGRVTTLLPGVDGQGTGLNPPSGPGESFDNTPR